MSTFRSHLPSEIPIEPTGKWSHHRPTVVLFPSIPKPSPKGDITRAIHRASTSQRAGSRGFYTSRFESGGLTGRAGSGRVRRFSQSHGSGKIASGCPDPTLPSTNDSNRENPWSSPHRGMRRSGELSLRKTRAGSQASAGASRSSTP